MRLKHREQVKVKPLQVVQQVLTMAPQISDELRTAMDDGLQRRPNWTSLEKVKTWLNL